MQLRRLLLSLLLAVGSIWCLGLVKQAHSEEKAGGDKFAPVAPLDVITAAQEADLKELNTTAAADAPKFKDIQIRANAIAELFNVKQYGEKIDAKAAEQGRDQALAVAKAAKAKDKEGVKKPLAAIEEALKKTSKAADGAAPPTAAYKPVAGIDPLMHKQQDIFDEMGKALDGGKDDDLKKVQADAQLMAELSNINAHQKPDKEDFVKWARDARDQSLALAKAAGAKDVEGSKTILKRQLKATCAACHEKYQ
jgi:hypothetical protein